MAGMTADDTPVASRDAYFQHVAHNGPLSGQDVISRFPRGFVLVDKLTNRCWIYKAWASEDGSTIWIVDKYGPWDEEKSQHAADGVEYDVLALDRPTSDEDTGVIIS